MEIPESMKNVFNVDYRILSSIFLAAILLTSGLNFDSTDFAFAQSHSSEKQNGYGTNIFTLILGYSSLRLR
ncbi:MAG: hypothetical protein ACRD92_01850 [Nitrosopumilaceae archaeon]